MNKGDLVAAIATKAEMTKKDAEAALDALIETVETAMKNKEKITLVGFGVWEVKQRAARKGINPRTKEEISIPATTVPVFKAGKALKEAAVGVKAETENKTEDATKKKKKK